MHACGFFELDLADGAADQRRVVDREIGDFEFPDVADHVALRVACIDSRGKTLTQPLMQRHHVVAAAQLQDIDRIFLLDIGDDGHFRRDLANRQNDIGIDRVATIGKDQAGLCHSEFPIGSAAVDIAGNDRNTVGVH